MWLDTSPEGVEVGQKANPVTSPEADDGSDFGGDWYARDLPYGYDTLVENLVGMCGMVWFGMVWNPLQRLELPLICTPGVDVNIVHLSNSTV